MKPKKELSEKKAKILNIISLIIAGGAVVAIIVFLIQNVKV